MQKDPKNREIPPSGALTESNLISFRLPPDELEVLSVLQVEGEGRNLAAKRLFTEALKRQLELNLFEREIGDLKREIKTLQLMLLQVAEGVVVATGRVSKEQAKEWIATKVCGSDVKDFKS